MMIKMTSSPMKKLIKIIGKLWKPEEKPCQNNFKVLNLKEKRLSKRGKFSMREWIKLRNYKNYNNYTKSS